MSVSRSIPAACIGAVIGLAALGCGGGSSGAAHIQNGDALLAESKLQRAVDEYELALKTSAREDALLRLLGAYESAGEYKKAQKYLDEAIQKRPTDPGLRLAKARIL